MLVYSSVGVSLGGETGLIVGRMSTACCIYNTLSFHSHDDDDEEEGEDEEEDEEDEDEEDDNDDDEEEEGELGDPKVVSLAN